MEQLKQISLRSKRVINETMLMSVGLQEASARTEFDIAVAMLADTKRPGQWTLLSEHREAWAKVWARGLIDVSGF